MPPPLVPTWQCRSRVLLRKSPRRKSAAAGLGSSPSSHRKAAASGRARGHRSRWKTSAACLSLEVALEVEVVVGVGTGSKTSKGCPPAPLAVICRMLRLQPSSSPLEVDQHSPRVAPTSRLRI
jgi:hypothetical protein